VWVIPLNSNCTQDVPPMNITYFNLLTTSPSAVTDWDGHKPPLDGTNYEYNVSVSAMTRLEHLSEMNAERDLFTLLLNDYQRNITRLLAVLHELRTVSNRTQILWFMQVNCVFEINA
jgi:hypothetical protein